VTNPLDSLKSDKKSLDAANPVFEKFEKEGLVEVAK
jgi:hypothetical protein